MKLKIIEINDIQEKYVKRINELLAQLTSTAQPISAYQLQSIIEGSNEHLFLMLQEQEIVAMTTLTTYLAPTGRKWWIEDVVVDEGHRRKHLGRKMIEHATSYAKEHGGGVIMLTSNPKRIAGNQLYRSLGFEQKDTNVYKKEV